MRISFSLKIALLLVLSIALVSAGIFFTTYYFISDGFDRQATIELSARQKSVASKLESLKEETLAETYLIASDLALAQAIAGKDTAFLQKHAKTILEKTRIDFLTITDDKGMVVARGHSDKIGDSAMSQLAIRKGLEGLETVGIEEGTVVKLSVRGGAPVKLGGRIVGAVSVGENLGSHGFVDQVKRDMGVECTIFNGDTRESTSIMREGKRAVGTKMDNPKVLETVLRGGGVFTSRNSILGLEYDTVYWPLMTADGKVGGMLFIGKDRQSIDATRSGMVWSILGSACVLGLVMLGVGLLAARSLTKPIVTTIDFARKVAGGQLDQELAVRRNDEIGDLAEALREMVKAIKDKIAEAEEKTREAASQAEQASQAKARAEEAHRKAEAARCEGMLSAAEQLEAVVQGISVVSSQLSKQIEITAGDMSVQEQRTAEAATAMEQMNATILEVSRSAQSAASQTGLASEKANQGNELVESAATAISGVDSLAGELKSAMDALAEQTKAVDQVMTTISDIADQTNLLALNAAIEAARAGEHGRGFAVVADEVRKLAEKTMHATREVGQTITAIQTGTLDNAGKVQRMAQAATQASELARTSGAALVEIVTLVETASDQVRAIATASEEQSAASEEITRSVDEIRELAGRIAQAMDQAGSTVHALEGQSDALERVIAQMGGNRLTA